MKIIFKVLFFLVLLSTKLSAQIPTGTEIWLLDMENQKNEFTFKNGINITNREGYDNQPAFSPDASYILYTAIYGDKQADFYKYTIATKKTEKYTQTPESEYSPTFTSDGKFVSSVRVESDSAQRLWKFDVKTKKPSLVNKHIDSIGYHCWINDTKIAVFLLTKPFTLQLMDVESDKTTLLAKDIGRAIIKGADGHSVIFTQLIDSVRWICSVDIETKEIQKIVKTIDKSEDIAMPNDHTFFMAKGGWLFMYDMLKDKQWKPIADLYIYGIKNITRLALSKDGKHIALVDNK